MRIMKKSVFASAISVFMVYVGDMAGAVAYIEKGRSIQNNIVLIWKRNF